MTRQRKKPLSLGEKSRMIKARKDSIMKKVEELHNLTELGACLIIPMPDGKFETWPKDGRKLQKVYKLYEESLKSQKENTNQVERSCCVTIDRQSCHESSAGIEKEENQYLASDFGNHELVYANEDFITGKELFPWSDQSEMINNSLPYSHAEAYNWLNESYSQNMMPNTNTTLDDNTMFWPLQHCSPEKNYGSFYGVPQPAFPLQVSYPARATALPRFESTSTEFYHGNRIFQPYITEQGQIFREVSGISTTLADHDMSTVMPQVFTQYHSDYMGGSTHNGKRDYYM